MEQKEDGEGPVGASVSGPFRPPSREAAPRAVQDVQDESFPLTLFIRFSADLHLVAVGPGCFGTWK